MKKILPVIFLSTLLINLLGCSTLHKINIFKSKNQMLEVLPPYSGLKAGVVIADFEVKSTKITNEAAGQLRLMLIKMLTDSNRFTVIESNTLNKDKSLNLIITASVVDFEPQASGGSGGVGGGGGAGSGALGGLLGDTLNKAHIALDMRVVDAATSEVIASTKVLGQATEAGTLIAGGELENYKALAIYAHTPMEKAIRLCLMESARYIVQKVPSKYYKY